MEFMAADQFKDDFLLPQIIFCYFISFGILPIDIDTCNTYEQVYLA